MTLKTFYYGEKGWFQYVTRLHAGGLIPGATLTDQHVSKDECKEMFAYGGQQSNNGYRTTKRPDFNERLQWLWLRVHQVEKPVNNDFGLSFAQGMLYEYKSNEEVDWAEFAVRTVNRFRSTRGVNQVHPNWTWAHPSVTVDIESGVPTCRDYDFPNSPGSKPIRRPPAMVHDMPRSGRSARKGQREEPLSSDYDSDDGKKKRRSKRKSRSRIPVKYESPVQRQWQPTEAAGVQGLGSASMATTDSALESPPDIETKETDQHPGEPSQSNAGPPRPSRISMHGPITDKVMASLMIFESEIPKMVEGVISMLELQKRELQLAFDNAHEQACIAKSTKSELTSKLVEANLALLDEDNDASKGEVLYIQCGLKYAEGRVEAAVAKEKEALQALQAQCAKVEDRRKAQWILQEHFLFNNDTTKTGPP